MHPAVTIGAFSWFERQFSEHRVWQTVDKT